MWKKQKKNNPAAGCIETLISSGVTIEGDIHYRGGIQIDGTVNGNIIAEPESDESLVRITRGGRVRGDLVGPNITINGRVDGNVHCSQHVELASQARVFGNVHYNLIEMVVGAEVNGSLCHLMEGEIDGTVDIPKESPSFNVPAEAEMKPQNGAEGGGEAA